MPPVTVLSFYQNRGLIGLCFLFGVLALYLAAWNLYPFVTPVLALVLVLAAIIKGGRQFDQYSCAVVFLYTLLVLQMYLSPDSSSAFSHGLVLLSGLLVFYLFKRSALAGEQWHRVVVGLGILGCLSALVGLVQYADDFQRASGPIIDANNFSAILYCSSLLLFTLNKPGLVTGGCQLLLLGGMFATFSRSGGGAWLLATAGFGVVLYRFSPVRIQHFWRYCGLAVAAYLLVKVVPAMVGVEPVSRSFSDMNSLGQRWPIWLSTWELIKQSPWLGSGFGSFGLLYPAVRTEFFTVGLVAHNDYLQLLQEGGLFTVMLFAAWLGIHLYWLFRMLWLSSHDKNKGTEFALLLVINLALFAHATLNFIFYNFYLNIISWLIFARIFWLACELGFISSPRNLVYGRRLSQFFGVLLVLLCCRTVLTEGANTIYRSYSHKPAVVNEVAARDDLLQWYLRIDPVSTPASEVYIRKLLFMLPLLSEHQQRTAFDAAWEQAALLQRERPLQPVSHLLAGQLLARGFQLGIKDVPDAAMVHWQSGLALNPDYIPIYLEVARELERKSGPRAALDYLLGPQLVRLNSVVWTKAEPYWQEARRLADSIDPELAEKIHKLIIQAREKVGGLPSLRRYYKG